MKHNIGFINSERFPAFQNFLQNRFGGSKVEMVEDEISRIVGVSFDHFQMGTENLATELLNAFVAGCNFEKNVPMTKPEIPKSLKNLFLYELGSGENSTLWDVGVTVAALSRTQLHEAMKEDDTTLFDRALEHLTTLLEIYGEDYKIVNFVK